MSEQEINVERPLMRLVDDDRVVFTKERVALDFCEQHAVGEKLHHGAAGRLVVEPDFAADFATPRHAHFFGDAARNRKRGDPARLRACDSAGTSASSRETHFWNLGGFAGTRFAGENHHGICLDRRSDLLGAHGDGQLGREFETEGKWLGGRIGHEILVCHSIGRAESRTAP